MSGERMSQEEFDARLDAGEDIYGIVADDYRRRGWLYRAGAWLPPDRCPWCASPGQRAAFGRYERCEGWAYECGVQMADGKQPREDQWRTDTCRYRELFHKHQALAHGSLAGDDGEAA